MPKFTLYKHQIETIRFLKKRDRAYIASTPGTGKTICIIQDINHRLNANLKSKTLVLAPKSLLRTVWQNEFNKFAPHIITSVAVAPEENRLASFMEPANVYITNVDALVWLATQPTSFWDNFETVIIDESTSIANNSNRTKAALKLRKYFKYRRCLSGTPTSGLLTQLFFQYLFLDDGATLGTSFTKFRNQVLISKQTGPHPKMVTWSNKPGREKVLARILKPMTIRYVLNEVVDMPPTVKYTYTYKLNAKTRAAYTEMKKTARATLKTGIVTAINAAVLVTKLRQISAGLLLDTETQTKHLIDTQRYDLVLNLCIQYKKAVVFFNWTAQRVYFMEQANKQKLRATYIDGSVSEKERANIIKDYEADEYDILFLQTQSGAHGLTILSAHVTIWASPTYLSDYYSQGNNRVYRIGQTKRTTVINIEAEDTLDGLVYDKLNNKLNSMDLLTEAL